MKGDTFAIVLKAVGARSKVILQQNLSVEGYIGPSAFQLHKSMLKSNKI